MVRDAPADLVDRATTGQVFEFLIGLGNAVTPHHGLHRLCQDLPGGRNIGVHFGFIELKLAKAFLDRTQRDHQVPDGYPKVTLHGGVRKVALPARHRQFLGHMSQ